ncbi:MAG: hypothetical protein KDA79_17855, partial [Planctomycetaceae bacterium]|nr:hypothetical protein [Planctomycetaceae bacterium]
MVLCLHYDSGRRHDAGQDNDTPSSCRPASPLGSALCGTAFRTSAEPAARSQHSREASKSMDALILRSVL